MASAAPLPGTPPTVMPVAPPFPHVSAQVASFNPGEYGQLEEPQPGIHFVTLNDEVLTSVANATAALNRGQSLEKIAVLYQFPQFLEHCPYESIHVMVPAICDILVETHDTNVMMASAEALYYVVNIKMPFDIAKCLAVASLKVVNSLIENEEVFDGCGELLSMVLPQVAKKDILSLVVPTTLQCAQSPRVEVRRLAARIIGSLEHELTADQITQWFYHNGLKLVADNDHSVRAMMAQSMGSMATNLSPHLVSKDIWPRLRDLLSDDNMRVRAAAMRALAKSAFTHRKAGVQMSFFRQVLKSLFLEECEKIVALAQRDLRTVSDDAYLMLEIFSEVFGQFLCALEPLLSDCPREITSAQAALKAMATCNGPTVRHWCSYNMPGVSSVLVTINPELVVQIVQTLASDTDMETRATLAAGIKDTVKALSDTESKSEITEAITTLILDETTQVRMNALQHLADLLELLSPGTEKNLQMVKAQLKVDNAEASGDSEEGTRDAHFDEKTSRAEREMRRLNRIFESLEMIPFDSWRTQELLAEQLRKAAHLVPQKMLCEHVAPLLFTMARESTYLVRKAAMRAVMHVMRYIPDVRRRSHIIKHLKNQWARGKVYWTRIAFIDGAEYAIDVMSIKLFNQLFKKELLRLTEDKVPNVKSRLLRLFDRLVVRWKSSQEFSDALKVLATDGDTQVANEAANLFKKLQTVGSLSPAEQKEEKIRQRNEDAFFVHRPKRRKGEVPPAANAAPKKRQSVMKTSMKTSHVEGAANGSSVPKPVEIVEEQKGASQVGASPVNLQERRTASATADKPMASENVAKPGFFRRLFSCFG